MLFIYIELGQSIPVDHSKQALASAKRHSLVCHSPVVFTFHTDSTWALIGVLDLSP